MSPPEQLATREQLRELGFLLDRLVKCMTRRSFATPRQMQVDVGSAMSLLGRMGHFPRRPLMVRNLPDLLRELGNRRPDLFRYVVLLEETVTEIRQLLDLPEEG